MNDPKLLEKSFRRAIPKISYPVMRGCFIDTLDGANSEIYRDPAACALEIFDVIDKDCFAPEFDCIGMMLTDDEIGGSE